MSANNMAACYSSTCTTFNLLPHLQVMSNLYGVMRDPKIWSEPEVFKPQRFLSDDGTVIRFEQWIPFSMGMLDLIGHYSHFNTCKKIYPLCATI